MTASAGIYARITDETTDITVTGTLRPAGCGLYSDRVYPIVLVHGAPYTPRSYTVTVQRNGKHWDYSIVGDESDQLFPFKTRTAALESAALRVIQLVQAELVAAQPDEAIVVDYAAADLAQRQADEALIDALHDGLPEPADDVALTVTVGPDLPTTTVGLLRGLLSDTPTLVARVTTSSGESYDCQLRGVTDAWRASDDPESWYLVTVRWDASRDVALSRSTELVPLDELTAVHVY